MSTEITAFVLGLLSSASPFDLYGERFVGQRNRNEDLERISGEKSGRTHSPQQAKPSTVFEG